MKNYYYNYYYKSAKSHNFRSPTSKDKGGAENLQCVAMF